MKNKTFKKVLSFVTVCSVVSTIAFTPIVQAEDIDTEGEKSGLQEGNNEYNYNKDSQLAMMLYDSDMFENIADNNKSKEANISITSPIEGTILDTTKGEKSLQISVEGSGNVKDIESIEVFADGQSLGEVVGDNLNLIYTPETSGKTGIKDINITAKATLSTDEVLECNPVNIKVRYEKLDSLKVYIDENFLEETNINNGVFSIVNEGIRDIDLNNIKIRYYFISDSNMKQNFHCNNADMTLNVSPWYANVSNNIIGEFVKLENPTEDADTYLEISFNDLKNNLNAGSKIVIQIPINDMKFIKSNIDEYNVAKEAENIVIMSENL